MSGGFWAHAFDSFGDNLDLIGAAGSDLFDNVNPFSEEFGTGNAYSTAAEVERQRARDEGREIDPDRIAASGGGGLGTIRDAAEGTVDEVKAAAGSAIDTTASVAGSALDLLTNPYVLGLGALVIVGILVAPYAVPALKAVT